MDPFSTAQTVDQAAASAPAPTTFSTPSAVAEMLVGAQPQWEPKSCLISVNVPVGGETTISSETIQNALSAMTGEQAGIMHPTAFHIVGAQSHNPSGVPIGINISNTMKTAVHIDADSSVQAFSGIMANRFHPTADTCCPMVGVEVNDQARADRVAIAQKWAGVKPQDLLTGVQQMTSARVAGQEPETTFAVPVAYQAGEEGNMVQQPLAWCIERNMANLGDQVKMATMPTSSGVPVDHFLIGKEAMESIVGATTQNVFGAQTLEDITISAQPLGSYSGEAAVTVGLRVDAEELTFLG
jgi:hypothetical protein